MSARKRSLSELDEFETPKENVTVKRNSKTVTENDSVMINGAPVNSKEGVNNTIEQLSVNSFMTQFKEKKKRVEDTHTRDTYLIRNDLLNRLNKHARKNGKGFKTQFVNYAIERALNELESN